MPATITVDGSRTFTRGSTVETGPVKLSAASSTAKRNRTEKTILTTNTVIPNGEVVNIGLVEITNLDATNFIKVGIASGQYTLLIYPGQTQPFIPNGNTIHCIADTASVLIDVTVYEK